MKKFFICVLAAIAVTAACGALAACDKNSGGTAIENVSVNLEVEEGVVILNWQPVKDVTFSVYRSNSRYGNMELVQSGITNGIYADTVRCAHYRVEAYNSAGEKIRTFDNISEENVLGENVYVFSPDDDAILVNDTINTIYKTQYDEKTAEFNENRYAVMFKEGVYDNRIQLSSGYYTTFHGLGETPNDVSVRSLKCVNGTNGNACINFWRGVENFTLRTNTVWAVSQGAYMRGMKIVGNLQFHDSGAFASGGFFADGFVAGTVQSGSQQQWLSRNCNWSSWEGSVWNMCFAGCEKSPSESAYPTPAMTVEQTTSVREKPFLVFDEDFGYRIAVPALRKNAKGCSWTEDNLSSRIERYIDMDGIYFANPSDTGESISGAISAGKSVVLTPGIYKLSSPIRVENDNAVILGLGIATLTPTGGEPCMVVGNCKNVSVSGVLFDAGKAENDCLFYVGEENGNTSNVNLYDIFVRVGGAANVKTYAETAMKIYADSVIGDNFWIWRADHDLGTGWDDANGTTGLEVYGDNVTVYGLMAEHFRKHNTVWYGENGKIFFYQSEIAYDVPSQSLWLDGERNGYSSLKVDDKVNTFIARGLGVYSNFHTEGIVLDSAILVPDKSGVKIEHACITNLNGNGAIKHIVNQQGDEATNSGAKYLSEYVAGA